MLDLPPNVEASRLLERLGVSAQDRDEALLARPDPLQHPVLWRHLEECYRELMRDMGSGLPAQGFRGLPAMPTATDPVALHLYVWLYLAVLPETLRYHAERGIDRRISWETLSSLAPIMAEHRTVHGLGGVGRFGQWCPPLVFRGAEYRLGRLAYDRGRGEVVDGTTEFVLHMHIPPDAPLSPSDCDESLGRARIFFDRHFSDEPVANFVCHSWLLDPQLTEYLTERSNIVRFLYRFELKPLAPGGHDRADGDMLEYLFGRPSQDGPVSEDLLRQLPQDTSLRRAYVTHLQSGRHWHARTGWIAY
ncbi:MULTISPECIES: acyltransferase domain-containing protein [unclassified Streptomyces]|uniref:acyltransferase domain-containing protein n=1 Tax=unclassified Streptomyces TaxID=2593676 RepID=UPI003077D9ED